VAPGPVVEAADTVWGVQAPPPAVAGRGAGCGAWGAGGRVVAGRRRLRRAGAPGRAGRTVDRGCGGGHRRRSTRRRVLPGQRHRRAGGRQRVGAGGCSHHCFTAHSPLPVEDFPRPLSTAASDPVASECTAPEQVVDPAGQVTEPDASDTALQSAGHGRLRGGLVGLGCLVPRLRSLGRQRGGLQGGLGEPGRGVRLRAAVTVGGGAVRGAGGGLRGGRVVPCRWSGRWSRHRSRWRTSSRCPCPCTSVCPCPQVTEVDAPLEPVVSPDVGVRAERAGPGGSRPWWVGVAGLGAGPRLAAAAGHRAGWPGRWCPSLTVCRLQRGPGPRVGRARSRSGSGCWSYRGLGGVRPGRGAPDCAVAVAGGRSPG